jgi:hypothetical protein
MGIEFFLTLSASLALKGFKSSVPSSCAVIMDVLQAKRQIKIYFNSLIFYMILIG